MGNIYSKYNNVDQTKREDDEMSKVRPQVPSSVERKGSEESARAEVKKNQIKKPEDWGD